MRERETQKQKKERADGKMGQRLKGKIKQKLKVKVVIHKILVLIALVIPVVTASTLNTKGQRIVKC